MSAQIRSDGSIRNDCPSPTPQRVSDTPRTDEQAFSTGHAGESCDVVDADFARELERENTKLRDALNNPHAVHAHYLRIGNGWEVWTSERVRGMEQELVELRAKIERQAERIRYLEGATNHATGTPLTKLMAEVERLREDKSRLDWLDENMSSTGGGNGATYSFRTPADVESGLLRTAIDAAMANPIPTKPVPHNARLEAAVSVLNCDAKIEAIARNIAAALPDESIFWGEESDGERYIEWEGEGRYCARFCVF